MSAPFLENKQVLQLDGAGTPPRDPGAHVFSPAEGMAEDVETRTVDVHIRWLREKLGRFGKLGFEIVTVRGAGYRLDPIRDPAAAAS